MPMPEESHAILLRLPVDTWRRVSRLAGYDRRSVSNMVVWLVEKALADMFVPDDTTQETPA